MAMTGTKTFFMKNPSTFLLFLYLTEKNLMTIYKCETVVLQ